MPYDPAIGETSIDVAGTARYLVKVLKLFFNHHQGHQVASTAKFNLSITTCRIFCIVRIGSTQIVKDCEPTHNVLFHFMLFNMVHRQRLIEKMACNSLLQIVSLFCQQVPRPIEKCPSCISLLHFFELFKELHDGLYLCLIEPANHTFEDCSFRKFVSQLLNLSLQIRNAIEQLPVVSFREVSFKRRQVSEQFHLILLGRLRFLLYVLDLRLCLDYVIVIRIGFRDNGLSRQFFFSDVIFQCIDCLSRLHDGEPGKICVSCPGELAGRRLGPAQVRDAVACMVAPRESKPTATDHGQFFTIVRQV